MLSFERYMTRFGEIGVQAIIERLERYDGISGNRVRPLEERWKALMGDRAGDRANVA